MGELSRKSDIHDSPRSSVAAADRVVRPSGKMVVSKEEKLTSSLFFATLRAFDAREDGEGIRLLCECLCIVVYHHHLVVTFIVIEGDGC